jgi:hypothetical protein
LTSTMRHARLEFMLKLKLIHFKFTGEWNQDRNCVDSNESIDRFKFTRRSVEQFMLLNHECRRIFKKKMAGKMEINYVIDYRHIQKHNHTHTKDHEI